MPSCLIALGANLGDRRRSLELVIERLSAHPGMRLIAHSRWYETAPIGGPSGQGAFLNGAVAIETSLSPEALMIELDNIETDLGRERRERWAARAVDLDLLLYGELIVDRPDLKVPHPRMAWRRFVLQPAAEIAPSMKHPQIGWTIERLYNHLQAAQPYVAITGPPGAGQAQLASAIAQRLGAHVIHETHNTSGGLFTATDRESSEAVLTWLEEQAALLRPQSAGPPDKWIVSDFWFDQALACVAASLPETEAGAIVDRWQTLRQAVMLPKLLVVLGPAAPSEGSTLAAVQVQSEGADWVRDCRLAIEQQVSDSPPCPTLRLVGAELDEAVIELTAALEAMQ